VSVLPAARERDGVGYLLELAGEDWGAAVILTALLRALGERVQVESAVGKVFVRVEVAAGDIARLPPYTSIYRTGDRYFIPLAPRAAHGPVGYLPQPMRHAIRRLSQALSAETERHAPPFVKPREDRGR
jgi:hypothetical protein